MTLRVIRGICAAFVPLALLGAANIAGWADLPAHFDARTMIPVAEIKPGMKGTAKSVFRGVEITEFNIEVLGVLPKFDLGGDLVLVRALDGPLVERDSGVVGGMSGSPVYVDGRLIGAIAYSWSFEKEPIGGVTPMESMLSAYVEKAATEEKTAATDRPPVILHGRRLTAARIAAPADGPFADAQTINMVPVGALSCSGLTRQSMADVSQFFEPYGLEPIAGPGTLDEPVETDLLPGAAVSVELMRGDFSSSLIGTVTYRDGESLLAFGHPFMQLGAVDMPMATAYIHEFIPSYSRSDKMGSAMEMVGSLRIDGGWSVGGLLGPVADMVPVEVSVSDETTGRKRAFRVDVARDKNITQSLVSMAIANSVGAGFRPSGEGTARVRFEVEGQRGAKVVRENVYWDRGSIAAACTREVSSTIYVLRRNPFDPQEPARVQMDLSLSDENISAAIDEVYTDETVAKAGETLTVHVVLRPWDGEPYEKVVELAMPEDLARGTMRVGVCGGEAAYTMRTRLGLLQPDFHDLPSIIKDIERTELNNQLFVGAALPNTSVGVAHYLLHRLPSSVASILSASRTTDVRGGKEEVSKLLDSEKVILGQTFLTLATEDKTGARASTPPPSTSKPPPSGNSQPSRTTTPAGGADAVGRINPMTAPPLGWAEDIMSRAWPTGRRVGSPVAAKRDGAGTDAALAPETARKPKEAPPSAPPSSEEEEDEGALTRSLSEWRQSTEEDFKEGEAKGIAVRSDGGLYCADKKAASWQTAEHRGIWSIAAAEAGPVYFGTGKDGHIYKVAQGGEPELIHETGELGVHALTLSNGSLYAGTIPDGKLLKIDPADPKSAQTVADFADDYIWALLPDDQGGVYAGTGSEGRIYHITAAGDSKLLADLPAQHVLCLTRFGDDLLAGTAESGVVYRVAQDGTFQALHDDEAPAITGLAVTEGGEVYACTSKKAHVVRITPGKEPLTVLELDKNSATAMAAMGETAYVGTDDDGKVLAVLAPDRWAVAAETEASEVSCLAVAGNRLLVGAANPGLLVAFDTGAESSGSFESAVLDTERIARWGSVLWTGDVPEGAKVDVQVRVGSTADPDDGTWNGWSYSYPAATASRVSAPPARFFQYRVQMSKSGGEKSPVFGAFVLRYLPANQKPEVKLTAPLTGAAISGEYSIKWEATDPDDDTLRYALYFRPDGAEEWNRLEEQLEDEDYEWDTTDGVEEGIVAVRVVGTDALSNPGNPLEKESLSYPVLIDNTPPELRQDGEPQIGDDRTVQIKGTASDSASHIVSVEYRIGAEGKWQTARPADGVFDSLTERFEVHTAALDSGQHVITVRVRDAAGNKEDSAVSAVIPEEEKEEPADKEGEEEGNEARKEEPQTEGDE